MSAAGRENLTRGQEHPVAFNGATSYYRRSIDPDDNFNRIEITLSHLFREPSSLLGGETYGSAWHAFMARRGLLRPDIVEIGGGLGDVMRCLLQADAGKTIRRCKMIDVSTQLRERQRLALSSIRDVEISIEEGSCETISSLLPHFCGLVFCNGVIADLATHRLDDHRAIEDLMIDEPEVSAFAGTYSASFPCYLPTGTLRFLRELRACLQAEAVAIVTEYQRTPLNQPSWFDNHYECGIDFDLVAEFARQLGFNTELLDVPAIIGFDDRTPLLTIDMFTMRDKLAGDVPRVAELARLPVSVPVAAYSKRTFADILRPHIESQRLEQLMRELDGYFQPINVASFDRKNPTTWSYKALILRPPTDHGAPR